MLWREVLAFHLAGWSCAWPTLATVAPTDVVRVAVVADPQLTDATSYPSFAPASSWTLAIVERVSDAFQHRAFRRALLPRRPDRVLFLGDLTDGGYATADPREFERVRDRFDRIFRWPRRTEDDASDENENENENENANEKRNRRAAHAPGYLAVHGNHDVGYAYHLARFPRVAARHEASFGPPAFVAAIGGVDVVAVDAMALDGDERRDERTKRAWAFVDALKREQREEDDVDETSTTPADETSAPADETSSSAAASSERRRRPRLLVSHLPLATSDEGRGPGPAACGALRGSPVVPQRVRRGPGGAVAYQNYLSAASSARLLEAVDPALVLSGHDHDQCVETHEYRAPPSRGGGGAEAAAGGRVRGSGGGKTKTVEERTIGAFGWLMGNPRPSFAMLTLRGEGAGDSEGEATEAAGRDAADGGAAAARGGVGVGPESESSPEKTETLDADETVAGGVAATRVCFLPEHLRTVRAYAALGAVTALALLVRPSLVVTAAFITAGGAGSDAFAARVFGGEGEDGGGGGRGGGATESSSPARKRIIALTLARAAWRHCGPFFVVAAVVVGLLAGLTLADLATS